MAAASVATVKGMGMGVSGSGQVESITYTSTNARQLAHFRQIAAR
jgi:hypothetical protein